MKLTKKLLTTALLGASVFSFQSTAWAIEQSQMIQVEQLYKQKDFKAMLAIIQPLAEQGDAISQFLLGGMYEEGLGVKQDYFEAVKWFRKAAEQGYAKAQASLGSMYYKGHGVKQDYFEAVKWYRKAAEQGDAKAQFIVGGSYLLGKGVQVNKSLAKEWLGKACDNGHQDGCEYYGKLNRGEM
ncbi:sel1 repeat family protein [Haemophilus influenzae]